MAKILPAILAAALCAVVLRTLAPAGDAFAAPQVSVHQACRPVSVSGAMSLASGASAIVSGKPAREG
eukprot:12414978-Heterocapsa_arctica.AAC.1